ncbi:DUF559 domain-containing protein [Nakamurella sp.]|uniref:DUF559 domain-containing protein n=1 Tax=Nakamurella sp. TaxID=1869182 RepID=UPI003B3B71DC
MTSRFPIPDELRDGIFTPHWLSYSRKRMRGPDLVVPFRGVRAVAGGPADPAAVPTEALRIRCRAALLTVCQGAVVSSVTAARVWPLPLPAPRADEPLHISVFAPDHAPRRRGVIGHQIRDQEVGAQERFGVGVTDPASLFCHLAATLSLPDLVAVGDALILRPRYGAADRPYLGLDALSDRVQWYRGRGKTRASAALALIRPGAESRPETLVRLALVEAGLPEPSLNVDIHDDAGRFLARGDLVYERWRTIVEYDGDHHRADPDQYSRDLARLDDLAAAGWRVVRVAKGSFFRDRRDVVRRVRAALLSAGWAG